MGRNSVTDDMLGELADRGSALRFQDIEGIGAKTESQLTSVRGVDAPKDVEDYTADELADEAGISRSRAEKAIRGAGGNPERKARSSTGSVSAAGIRVPVGEFRVEISDKDSAEAKFSSSLNRGIGRSQEAAAADKGKRAPITTDFETWNNNKGRYDYPGVDTPTDDPQVRRKDSQTIEEEDTTLDTREGTLFARENNITGGVSNQLKGLFSGSRGADPATRKRAAEFAERELEIDTSVPSGSEGVADITFLEREKDSGFGEELVPFEATESDRNSFEF